MKRIIFVHQYDDYSGSPRVLRDIVECLSVDHQICLVISDARDGFLSRLMVDKVKYKYYWSHNKIARVFFYICSQIHLFYIMTRCKKVRNADFIYINTLLPVGASIFSILYRKKVILHLHEAPQKSFFYRVIFKIFYQKFSKKIIFVSEWQRKAWKVKNSQSIVLENPLSPEFKCDYKYFRSSARRGADGNTNFQVLMPCSLRHFKGVGMFLDVAKAMVEEKVRFTLLLNEKPEVVNDFKENTLANISNVRAMIGNANPIQFYRDCDVVVNLSQPDLFIETFGMTIIEGFSQGKPAIAPNIGGPTEIITNGENGFLVDTSKVSDITEKIRILANDNFLYIEMSSMAFQRSKYYSIERIQYALQHYILKEI